jgi:molybdopterin converting factor small subunit
VHVKVLFFASIKDIVGSSGIEVDIPVGSTVGSVFSALEAKYPRLAGYRPVMLTSLNEEYANLESKISEATKAAFSPPVSGGAVRQSNRICNTHEEIDAWAIVSLTSGWKPARSASFEGIVQANSNGRKTRHLVYEGHERDGPCEMEEIAYSSASSPIDAGALCIAPVSWKLRTLWCRYIIITSTTAAPHDVAIRYRQTRAVWFRSVKEIPEDGEAWVELHPD